MKNLWNTFTSNDFNQVYFIYCQKSIREQPGRPVISNNSTATENISAFLDFYLKPLVAKVPNILENTRDVLNRITEIKDLPDDALLV